MRPVFVDTSYLIALEASDDQHHATAKTHWDGFRRALPSILTTSFVFDEVVTFFNSRGLHGKAVEIGNRILGSKAMSLVPVDETLFSEGWRYLCAHEDKTYSLTDCISFVLMARMGITTALCFDRHFAQAGLAVLPEPEKGR